MSTTTTQPTTPAERWTAARIDLSTAIAEGATGGRLLRIRAQEFDAWFAAAEAALTEERPGAVLADFPDEDWQFLHGDAAGLTPSEAAAWMTAEAPADAAPLPEPVALDSLDAIRPFVGRKVKLAHDFDQPVSRHRNARTVRRTAHTVGTIIPDDRTTAERYLIMRRTQGNILLTSAGYRVVKVFPVAS